MGKVNLTEYIRGRWATGVSLGTIKQELLDEGCNMSPTEIHTHLRDKTTPRSNAKPDLPDFPPGDLSQFEELKPVATQKYITERVMKPYLKGLIEISKGLNVCKPYYPEKTPKAQTEVLVLGDWHLGKLVDMPGNKYNIEIARQRVQQLCTDFIDIVQGYSRPQIIVDEIALLLVGDFVENELIFPTQAHHIETDVVTQVRVATEMFWGEMILPLRKAMPRIPMTIHCVKGNHGRVGSFVHETANWDLVLYHELASIAQYSGLKDIHFNIGHEAFTQLEIKGHKGLLRHEGIPQHDTAAARAKISGWKAIHDMEFMCTGHWHNPFFARPNNITVFQNGCMSGMDDLSEKMARKTKPFQLSWGVSEKRVTTHIHVLDIQE